MTEVERVDVSFLTADLARARRFYEGHGVIVHHRLAPSPDRTEP